MQSLHAHLCLVIVMILQKSYALPTSAVKTDSSLFSSNRENSHACAWDREEGVLIALAETSLTYHGTCIQIYGSSTCLITK